MQVLMTILSTVLAASAPAADAVVSGDGSGQFKTVQEAIDAAPQLTSHDRPWVIEVKPGTYKELVYIQREKRFITLRGSDDAEKTIITSSGLNSYLGTTKRVA